MCHICIAFRFKMRQYRCSANKDLDGQSLKCHYTINQLPEKVRPNVEQVDQDTVTRYIPGQPTLWLTILLINEKSWYLNCKVKQSKPGLANWAQPFQQELI